MTLNLRLKYSHFYYTKIPLNKTDLSFIQKWYHHEYSHFSESRLEQFLAGRFCAIKAAAKFNFELLSLPMDHKRRPLWPKGITGSISHTKNFAIAIVSNNAKSIGVDIESIIEAERWSKIKSKIITEDEQLIAEQKLFHPTLIFSAKETLYKLISPLADVFFDFLDAQLFTIEDNKFFIELKSDKKELKSFNGIYEGYYIFFEDQIITYIEN